MFLKWFQRMSGIPCLVFEVIWKNPGYLSVYFFSHLKKSRGSLCFVFEAIWKNLGDTLCFVFKIHSLKGSRGLFLFCFWSSFWNSLGDPLFCFWSKNLKEFRRPLCFVFEVVLKNLGDSPCSVFWSGFEKSQGPLLFCCLVFYFWSDLEGS